MDPHWRRDGKELYFMTRKATTMMVAAVHASDTFHFDAPHVLFATRRMRTDYDVSADGLRFVLPIIVNQDTDVLEVVVDWTAA
jgi:hypothetical protein